MQLNFRKRIVILGLLMSMFLVTYGAAQHFSPAIVGFVVRHTLLQKVPDGTSALQVEERFEAWLDGAAPEARMRNLLILSNFLEKVQKLTPAELERLLPPAKGAS